MPDDDAPILDLKGLRCPLPALLTRRRLLASAPGTRLCVLADDPMAPVDIAHMCGEEGFDLLQSERDGDGARFLIARR